MKVYGINMTSSYQYTFTLFSDSKPVVNTKENKTYFGNVDPFLLLYEETKICCYAASFLLKVLTQKKYLYIFSKPL